MNFKCYVLLSILLSFNVGAVINATDSKFCDLLLEKEFNTIFR